VEAKWQLWLIGSIRLSQHAACHAVSAATGLATATYDTTTVASPI